MFLITGAAGSAGGAVVEATRKLGLPMRAMIRSEKDRQKIPPSTPSVIADFADKSSLSRAVDGVNGVYIVCSPIPALVELESNMIEVCRAAGVKHVVLNSALGAADYPKSFPSWHRAVEEKLKRSGVPFTILRPNGFMQNILAYNAPSIRTQDAFYSSMGEAMTSYIDVRDLAVVAAKALAWPGDHVGKTYELNGPEAVSNTDLAERISGVAGRKITYVAITDDAQRSAMLGTGMPVWQVDALIDLQNYYKGGKGGELTQTLPSLLGREPVMLDRFLSEFKDAFRSEATTK